jgi:hypothetical protein
MESQFRVKGSIDNKNAAVELLADLLTKEGNHSATVIDGVATTIIVANYVRETCFVVVSYNRNLIRVIVAASGYVIDEAQAIMIATCGELIRSTET